MQQKVPQSKLCDLLDGKRIINELKDLRTVLKYRLPSLGISTLVLTFSDTAFNVSRLHTYGQTGIVTGLIFGSDNTLHDTFHAVNWCSRKQRRLCYSSYGAETLACTEADDRGFYIKSARTICSKTKIFNTRSVLTRKACTRQ